MPLHTGKGKSIGAALGRTVDYIENPEKTGEGEFISSYECDPLIAEQEFLFAKSQYAAMTGRSQGARDVIAYHLRQSFKPGEIDPQTANKIGYDLAMSLTKGKHAFIVCTHVDKRHIHSHIVFNSTDIECTRKFRNFWGSSFAIRKISDKLCLENGLSIVDEPKPSKGHYRKGAEARPHREKMNLLIDIQAKIQDGKGAGYEHWAKIFNVKQMAKTINYLHENGLTEYSELVKKSENAVKDFGDLAAQIKAKEKRMKDINELKKHIINYMRTKEVYAASRKGGFDEKHRADVGLHVAAKKHFNELGLKKLPTIKGLQAEYSELFSQNKELYAECQKVKKEMQVIVTARANVQRILGKEERKRATEKER